jgi:hypothetical protein
MAALKHQPDTIDEALVASATISDGAVYEPHQQVLVTAYQLITVNSMPAEVN